MSLVAFVACSLDESFENDTRQEIDMTLIMQPETARAASEFNTATHGIYRGVLATNTISYHGVITINVGNDGRYNAMLVSESGARMGFVLDNHFEAQASSTSHTFTNKNSSFTLDLANINYLVMLDVSINGVAAQSHVFKENSSSSIQVTMGAYADDNNASHTGTWDIISTSSSVVTIPTGQPFAFDTVDITQNFITNVTVMRNGGMMFTDTVMETFTPSGPCVAANPVLPSGPQLPFFVEGTVLVGGVFPLELDEIVAFSQTSNSGGSVTWDFAYSLFGGEVYLNDQCATLLNGTWTGATTSGTIVLN